MREIIFRGQRPDGKWIEGDLLTYLGYGKVHIAQNYKGAGGQEVVPETVGQYTGLKDKNGKRIFDGDIVWDEIEEEYAVISFKDGCFWLTYSGRHSDNEWHDIVNELQVIGNVADNTELLE